MAALAGCSPPAHVVSDSTADVFDLTSWTRASVTDDETIHTFTGSGNQLWGVTYGSGKVLRGTGRGSTWTQAADLSSEYLEKIQFVNQATGFTCGDYGFVYRTDDGGLTWIDISPDIEARITEPYRNDETKDQTPDGLFVAYYDMHFETPTSGYVWGFEYNPALGFRESRQDLLFVTHDAGVRWERFSGHDIAPARNAFLKRATQNQTSRAGTYHFDSQTQWRYERASGEHAIARSGDGGATWTQTLLPETSYERWIHREIVFLDRKSGLSFGGSLGDSDDGHAVVFRARDGGVTRHLVQTDWPHVHDAKVVGGRVHVSTKRSGFYTSPAFASTAPEASP